LSTADYREEVHMELRLRRLGAHAMVVVAMASPIAVGVASPALAAGGTSGSCSSTRGVNDIWGPNSYYVRASCASLGATTKARGVLDISGDSDQRTDWFTTLNKDYYSGAYRCGPGQCNNTRTELAVR
jgi:hypothetical protein